MTRETLETLNSQTLIGYTSKRGNAWHKRANLQGERTNHYEYEVPVADVLERLFNWEPQVVRPEVTIKVDGKPKRFKDYSRKAIVRPDTETVLGIFKNSYQPHSYAEWLIENVSTLLDADLRIGSAGLLRKGAWAWVQIEMEETMQACGMEFRPHLLATTSLDGFLATTYVAGNQVVVCDNTCTAAVNEQAAAKYKVKHCKKSLGKIDAARDALGIVFTMGEEFAVQIEALYEDKVDEKRWQDFLSAYTAPTSDNKRATDASEEKRAALTRLWRHDERVNPWKGTALGVMQAVNTYAHHEQPTLTLDRTTRNMERMVKGDYNKIDAATLTLLATV